MFITSTKSSRAVPAAGQTQQPAGTNRGKAGAMMLQSMNIILDAKAAVHESADVQSNLVRVLNPGDTLVLVTHVTRLNNGCRWYEAVLPDGAKGWIAGELLVNEAREAAFRSEPVHYLHEHLQLSVIHQEIKDRTRKRQVTDYGLLREDSYSCVRKPFLWNVDRPPRGKARYRYKCPYCGQELTIMLLSADMMKRYREAYADRMLKSFVIMILIIMLFIAIPIVSTFFFGTGLWLRAIAVFALFGAVLSLLTIREGLSMLTYTGMIGGEINIERKPIDDRRNGHYVSSINSN